MLVLPEPLPISEPLPKITTSCPACSNTFVEPTPTVKNEQCSKNTIFPFH